LILDKTLSKEFSATCVHTSLHKLKKQGLKKQKQKKISRGALLGLQDHDRKTTLYFENTHTVE
jgi:hypothetical protein